MTKFTVQRDVSCSADAFWAKFLDTAFNLKAFGTLGFAKYEVVDLREESGRLLRKAVAQPPIDAPAVVQKVLGPSFGYVEDGIFERATKTWTWKATPSVLADRSRIGGTVRVEDLGANRCRTTFDAAVDIKMLGLGGLIEATAEKTTTATWTKFVDLCGD
jgi:hypothetical protein